MAETVDTAGKAVAFSALTVLASLAAILIVPSPAFRSHGLRDHAVGRRRAGRHPDPAAGRAGQARDQHQQGQDPTAPTSPDPKATGPLDRMLHSWGRFLWRHPFPAGAAALVLLLLAAAPVIGMRTNMPSITIVPPSANARVGYYQVTSAFGPGAPGTLQVLVPAGEQAAGAGHPRPHVRGGRRRARARPTPGGPSTRWSRPPGRRRPPRVPPSTTSARCCRPGRLVGGAAAENHDLQQSLASHTPLVLGILGVLGFLLLLIALGAPLIAALGVLITALSVAGAFGIGRLIFQNGFLSGPLGFQPQGFIDAWAPLFFGAMVFGVAMDYTLFMLSAAKERYETHPDPEHAMVGSMRTSGRVVLSAAAVMIAVFLTFALSGPLAPKEMGVILAIAVALDALVVRLVVLPVVLRLGGHSAWHQPKWLGRILPKVKFSH